MQTIKIDTRGKGLYHWEDLLLNKLHRRLEKLLTQLSVDPWKKRKIHRAAKRLIKRENIVSVYSHPIREILSAILGNTISKLEDYSSSEIIP